MQYNIAEQGSLILIRIYLVLSNSACLEVALYVPRIKIRYAHQESRTSKLPQFTETENRL